MTTIASLKSFSTEELIQELLRRPQFHGIVVRQDSSKAWHETNWLWNWSRSMSSAEAASALADVLPHIADQDLLGQ